MGDEPFNDEDIVWDDNSEAEAPKPDFRVTVARGRLTVVPWQPFLLGEGGPISNLFRVVEAMGVTIADLTSSELAEGGRELTVSYLADGAARSGEACLVRWAQTVGYERIWLPNRLVTKEDFEVRGWARSTCSKLRLSLAGPLDRLLDGGAGRQPLSNCLPALRR